MFLSRVEGSTGNPGLACVFNQAMDSFPSTLRITRVLAQAGRVGAFAGQVGYRNLNSTIPFTEAIKKGGLVLLVALSLCAVVASPGAVQGEGTRPAGGAADHDARQDGLAGDKAGEILARVNGEPVMRTELRRLLADPQVRRQLLQELDVDTPDSTALRQVAVLKLIHRRLFLQEAGRQKLAVTRQALDQNISALRSRFADLESFGIWMQERGLDDRLLFGSIRDDMLVTRVMAALVAGVEVAGQQVQDYYVSHEQDLTIGEEVRLRIIVVASNAAARDILTALRAGGNFSRLARKHSLGLRAAQGGDTGWVNTATLTPPLERVVDRLQPGEASNPLHKDAGEFLVVALEGRRPARVKNLDEARPEIERRLLAAMRQETIQAWLREQAQNSTIEIFPQTNDSFPGAHMTRSDHGGT